MITINSSNTPLVYQQVNNYSLPSYTGAIQWNGMTKKLEVSTGTGWIPLDTNVNLTTNPVILETIEWAQRKMQEEKDLEALAKSNPAINDLVNQIKEKHDQIEMVKTLIKKEKELPEVRAYSAPLMQTP